jgi:hypothetical protein
MIKGLDSFQVYVEGFERGENVGEARESLSKVCGTIMSVKMFI